MSERAALRKTAIIFLAAALVACQEKPKEAAPQPTVAEHSIVIFPPGSPQLPQITSVPIEPRRDMVVRFNGRLVWNEDRTVRVFAPFGGRVMSIAVRPGDRVKPGQTLAVLAAPELGLAQAEARKADNDHALAQKNLARVSELFEAGVAPAKDLQAAQADVARTAAERAPGGLPENSVGFGIAIPLFTGYDFAGDIQKAEVDRYTAMDALARARAIAMGELRRAAGDLNAAADRLERFDASLLGAASRSAEASEFAFSRGAISVLEVLDARRTLRAVRLEALAARNDHAKALAAWRAAQSSVQTLEGR